MPLAGILCNCGNEDGEFETRDFDYCLGCARHGTPHNCKFSLPLIKYVAGKEETRAASKQGMEGYSSSELTGCARRLILSADEPYYQSPQDFYKMFQGDTWHEAMDRAMRDEPGAIVETRFYRKLFVKTGDVSGYDVVIHGKPDLIEPERGIITDHKRIGRSLNPDEPKAMKKPYDEHVGQVNTYAWIVAAGQNAETDERVDITITRGGIVYANGETMLKLSVPIWTPEEQEAYILDHIAPTEVYKAGGPLPAVLPARLGKAPKSGKAIVNRHFKCVNCPVKEKCDFLAEREYGVSPDDARYWVGK